MIALLDANMLIALFDAAHENHTAAHSWLTANRSAGWATCPLTQNACIRVLSQPNYPGHLTIADISRRLSNAIAAPDHTFWMDSLSLRHFARFHHDQMLSPRQLTDSLSPGPRRGTSGAIGDLRSRHTAFSCFRSRAQTRDGFVSTIRGNNGHRENLCRNCVWTCSGLPCAMPAWRVIRRRKPRVVAVAGCPEREPQPGRVCVRARGSHVLAQPCGRAFSSPWRRFCRHGLLWSSCGPVSLLGHLAPSSSVRLRPPLICTGIPVRR